MEEWIELRWMDGCSARAGSGVGPGSALVERHLAGTAELLGESWPGESLGGQTGRLAKTMRGIQAAIVSTLTWEQVPLNSVDLLRSASDRADGAQS